MHLQICAFPRDTAILELVRSASLPQLLENERIVFAEAVRQDAITTVPEAPRSWRHGPVKSKKTTIHTFRIIAITTHAFSEDTEKKVQRLMMLSSPSPSPARIIRKGVISFGGDTTSQDLDLYEKHRENVASAKVASDLDLSIWHKTRDLITTPAGTELARMKLSTSLWDTLQEGILNQNLQNAWDEWCPYVLEHYVFLKMLLEVPIDILMEPVKITENTHKGFFVENHYISHFDLACCKVQLPGNSKVFPCVRVPCGTFIQVQ